MRSSTTCVAQYILSPLETKDTIVERVQICIRLDAADWIERVQFYIQPYSFNLYGAPSIQWIFRFVEIVKKKHSHGGLTQDQTIRFNFITFSCDKSISSHTRNSNRCRVVKFEEKYNSNLKIGASIHLLKLEYCYQMRHNHNWFYFLLFFNIDVLNGFQMEFILVWMLQQTLTVSLQCEGKLGKQKTKTKMYSKRIIGCEHRIFTYLFIGHLLLSFNYFICNWKAERQWCVYPFKIYTVDTLFGRLLHKNDDVVWNRT